MEVWRGVREWYKLPIILPVLQKCLRVEGRGDRSPPLGSTAAQCGLYAMHITTLSISHSSQPP